MTNSTPNDHLRGLLFPIDGRVTPVRLAPDNLLRDLYRAIDCSMVEVVVLRDGIDLCCDEEALLKPNARPNRAWLLRRRTIAYPQTLVGNVIALGRSDDGVARSLTVKEAESAIDSVVACSAALGLAGDWRPDHEALIAWIDEGTGWLS